MKLLSAETVTTLKLTALTVYAEPVVMVNCSKEGLTVGCREWAQCCRVFLKRFVEKFGLSSVRRREVLFLLVFKASRARRGSDVCLIS